MIRKSDESSHSYRRGSALFAVLGNDNAATMDCVSRRFGLRHTLFARNVGPGRNLDTAELAAHLAFLLAPLFKDDSVICLSHDGI
jgi:hypothetical protein